METTVIIPARGGSKGIPFKNLQPIRNKPLIHYSISAALKCPYVTRVIVSTDSPYIAQEAEKAGAEVIVRPAELSTDTSSSEDTLLHALERVPKTPLTALIQCTSPLIHPEDITDAVNRLIETNSQTCFTACEDHSFLWTEDFSASATGLNHNSSLPRQRRQDLPVQYKENGCIYVMETEGFLAHKNRFFGKTCISPMPPERSLEIDTPFDLHLCKHAMISSRRPSDVKAVVMDFDGVLTDNTVTTDSNGIESVSCSKADSLALNILRSRGIHLLVLTNEVNPCVQKRCQKLSIPLIQSTRKYQDLLDYLEKHSLSLDNLCYIGNDTNDLTCLNAAGFSCCPSDAHPDVLASADVTLNTPGGQGVIRELVEVLCTL